MLVEFDITKDIRVGKFFLRKTRVIEDDDPYRPGMVYTKQRDKDYMSGYLVVTENRTRYLFGGVVYERGYFFHENLRANIVEMVTGKTRYCLYLLHYKFNRQDYINNRPTELRVIWCFSRYKEIFRNEFSGEIEKLFWAASELVKKDNEQYSS